MTKWIVATYSLFGEIFLLLFLVAGMSAAYKFIPDEFFRSAPDLWQFRDLIKIALGLIGTFLLEVFIFGPFLILDDIRGAVRAIERDLRATKPAHGGTPKVVPPHE